MSPDLEKLIALHEIDLQLIEYKEKIESSLQKCEQAEIEYKEFSSAFLSIQEQLEDARKKCRQAESDCLEAQAHHKKYQEDLLKVRNQKEYEVALREIDVAHKSINQLETQILETLEEIKNLETELNKFSPDIENKKQAGTLIAEELKKEQERYQNSIDKILQKRSKLEASISKSWFNSYQRIIKMRGGQALTEVINGTCSSCRMALRPQIFSEVRQGDIIYTCDHCSRILYYRPEVKVEIIEA